MRGVKILLFLLLLCLVIHTSIADEIFSEEAKVSSIEYDADNVANFLCENDTVTINSNTTYDISGLESLSYCSSVAIVAKENSTNTKVVIDIDLLNPREKLYVEIKNIDQVEFKNGTCKDLLNITLFYVKEVFNSKKLHKQGCVMIHHNKSSVINSKPTSTKMIPEPTQSTTFTNKVTKKVDVSTRTNGKSSTNQNIVTIFVVVLSILSVSII